MPSQGAGTWIGLVEPERLRRRRLEAVEDLFRQGDAIVAVYSVDRFDGLVAGRLGKQIVHDLGISPRTVEVYRASMMEKLRVRTLSELVRLVARSGKP
jgi:FixJ family two-component response regulator